MKNKSIVLELQQEAANPNTKVVTLVRKAKIIASKLDQQEFLKWIDNELKGYPNCTKDQLPQYRHVQGEFKALNPYHGWEPIMFQDCEGIKELRVALISLNIAGIENLALQKNNIQFPLPEKLKEQIRGSIGYPLEIQLQFPVDVVFGVLEAVRNIILDWTLELEKKGILGDEVSFSEDEKNEAKPLIVFAENISQIGNSYGNSQFTINKITAEEINISEVTSLIKEIQSNLHSLPSEKGSLINEQIEIINREIQAKTKDKSKISRSLETIKTICIGAASSVVAQGIIHLIDKIIL